MQLGERIWTDVPVVAHKVVVAPLGSFEQHGHHLRLLTDSMIGGAIAKRAEAELGDRALFLPLFWAGCSDRHRGMPGTISIRSATYDVQMRHRAKDDLWIAFASWWQIAADQVAAIEDLEAKRITQACEQETSMILWLRPELVRPDVARGANIPFEWAFYCPDEHLTSRVEVARTFDQLSETGAFAHPELASVEKGEALFAAVSAEVVAFVREFANWPQIAPC